MNLSVFLAILLDACISAQNSGSFASSLNTLVREATSCVVLLAAAPEMVRWGADGTLPDDRCERGQRHSWALARAVRSWHPGPSPRSLTDLAPSEDQWAEMDRNIPLNSTPSSCFYATGQCCFFALILETPTRPHPVLLVSS